ncbi:MAG: serine protease [Actinomycetia bacterium]|nr:serine protease [Actinomycetes bacterium]
MSKAGGSPWDKQKVPDGPRLVDDGAVPDLGSPRASSSGPPKDITWRSAPMDVRENRTRRFRRPGRIVGIAAGAGAVLLLIVFGSSQFSDGGDGFNVETAARSVVRIASIDCGKSGSGSLVTTNGLILTNSHVATENGRDICNPVVGFTDSYDVEPTDWYQAVVLVDDFEIDLAVLQVLDDDGSPLIIEDRDPIPLESSTPELGEQIQTLGYPGIGGQTMTFTSGDYAGVAELSGSEFYKTTASLNAGLSGGSAFNGSFRLIGVPTAGFGVDVICEENDCTAFGDSLGLVRPIRYAIPLIEEAKRLSR